MRSSAIVIGEIFGAVLTGGVVGTVVFSWLIGSLDRYFHISSCMQAWVWYAVPVGAILGGLSGCVLHLFASGTPRSAASTAIAIFLTLSPFACYNLRRLAEAQMPTLGAILTEHVPFLLWWVLFLVVGIAAHATNPPDRNVAR